MFGIFDIETPSHVNADTSGENIDNVLSHVFLVYLFSMPDVQNYLALSHWNNKSERFKHHGVGPLGLPNTVSEY